MYNKSLDLLFAIVSVNVMYLLDIPIAPWEEEKGSLSQNIKHRRGEDPQKKNSPPKKRRGGGRGNEQKFHFIFFIIIDRSIFNDG